ncbi:MAG: hypothetical protein KDE52_04270 [Calditrichaeota bacterium]|nr:hypothetical protein [Calditrichota bacterium]
MKRNKMNKIATFQSRLEKELKTLMTEGNLLGAALMDQTGLLIAASGDTEFMQTAELSAWLSMLAQDRLQGLRIDETTFVIENRLRLVNRLFGIGQRRFVMLLMLRPDQPYHYISDRAITTMSELLTQRYPKKLL